MIKLYIPAIANIYASIFRRSKIIYLLPFLFIGNILFSQNICVSNTSLGSDNKHSDDIGNTTFESFSFGIIDVKVKRTKIVCF